MQPASSLIYPLFKFAARVRNSQDDGRSRQIVPLVQHRIKRHTTHLVAYRDGAITLDTHPDVLPKTSHRLVNRVIQGLPEQMPQARGGSGPHMHAMALSNGPTTPCPLNVC